MTDLYKLQDPTRRYPRPKFQKQPQAAPGLDKKMKPKADHGETSYRGCGRLHNRKAIWTPLQTSGGQPQKKIMVFGSETPMKRPAQPVEVAPLYVLLASQEASYVTGEVYGVTGGLEIS